jgi:ribonuclease D
MPPPPHLPGADDIALLPVFPRLGLDRITLVNDADSASAALAVLRDEKVLGFDTESKPTFKVGEVSTGPHLLQLATCERAWLFLLHDAHTREAAAALLESPTLVKAGFGLSDDERFIKRKLNVEPHAMLDFNQPFRALGYKRDVGVKTAVALLFQQRFIKSKKAATSNWSHPRLTEAQVIYAANDAYAAARVEKALSKQNT